MSDSKTAASAALLPASLFSNVLQLLYPDGIPGTRGALAVSRAWRDAAPTCEPLHLVILIDDAISQQQLAGVGSWLQAHPEAVLSLQLRNGNFEADGTVGDTLSTGLELLLGALEEGLAALPPPAALQQPPAAQHLTSLCLDGRGSLLLVEPLLPYLQQLQHLEAGVSIWAMDDPFLRRMRGRWQWGQYNKADSETETDVENMFDPLPEDQAIPHSSFFCSADEDVEELHSLPNLSLATTLTSLHLKIYIHFESQAYCYLDAPIFDVLPANLRVLHVEAKGDHGVYLPNTLHKYVPRLRVLKLTRTSVTNWADLLVLTNLQQLALCDPGPHFQDPYALAISAGLAPVIVQMWCPSLSLLRSHASSLTALQSLRIGPEQCGPRLAAVLRQLRGLTRLDLDSSRSSTPDVAACITAAAALPELRELSIKHDSVGSRDQLAPAAAALTSVTQLTSLQLEGLAHEVDPEHWAAAVDSLTSLQHLSARRAPQLAPPTLKVLVLDGFTSPLPPLLQQLGTVVHTLKVLVLVVHSRRALNHLQQVMVPALRVVVPGLPVMVLFSNKPAPWCCQLIGRAASLPGVWRLAHGGQPAAGVEVGDQEPGTPAAYEDDEDAELEQVFV